MFHFNKNEIWTLQKPASLMTCLHRKRQFLFNGDYYREQIKLPGVYGLEIMGIEKSYGFTLCVCLTLDVSVCKSVSVGINLCLRMCVGTFTWVSDCVSALVCVSMCLNLCISVHLCESVCVWGGLCL